MNVAIATSPAVPNTVLDATELQLLMRLRDNERSGVHDVVEGDAAMWALGFSLSDRGLLAMVSHPKGGTFHITRLGKTTLSASLASQEAGE